MQRHSNNNAWCGAINCTASKQENPELLFHRFPSNPDLCKRWVQICRREDLLDKSTVYLNNNIKLCSRHFEPSQFYPNGKRLLRNAVPSRFNAPNPPMPVTNKNPLHVPPEPPQKKQKTELYLDIKEEPLPSPPSFTVDIDKYDTAFTKNQPSSVVESLSGENHSTSLVCVEDMRQSSTKSKCRKTMISKIPGSHSDYNSSKYLTCQKSSKRRNAHGSESVQMEILTSNLQSLLEVREFKNMAHAHHTKMEKYMESIVASLASLANKR